MAVTLLLARRPPDAGVAWLHRSLAALAARFRGARVRLLVADAEAEACRGGARAAPPPSTFDAVLLIERARTPWLAPSGPELRPRDEALAWLAGARGYRGELRELGASDGRPAPGQRAPGVVFAATAVRAPALSHEAFDSHWRERHAPLALRHHAGMSRYEQIPIERPLSAGAPPIDGLALLHFASADDFRGRFYDSEAGREAIAADTRRFLDLPRCEAALLGEYGVRG